MKFCPKCGGRLVQKIVHKGDKPRWVCSDCAFIFYLDPKVAACTIPEIDGKAVLIKRAIEPSVGKWTFPGGYVDRGESVKDAAIRETKEEVNLDVELGQLLNIYSYPKSDVIVIVYHARTRGGEISKGTEVAEVALFDPASIPWSELAFESTREALEDWVKSRAQKSEE
ncbi:MAG: NUDIX hydrolase [Candidatus Tectomicrobia bacterium]|nr:NUDIX hydrolase [Candidatus Tectomicrobia bacterium]